MNLKQRFSVIFSLLYSFLLGGVLFFIFTMFSQNRKEEFESRLAEKAETTIKLLLEVKEIDHQLLKIIDKNTIQRLYNEKVIIFDENMNLVYSSLDDAVLTWTPEDLVYLKNHHTFFRSDENYDVYGMYYDSYSRDYYALVTAEDKYGKRKLIYLKYLLWTAFGIGTASVWLLSFYLSKKSLAPLDVFTNQIQKVTDENLNIRLPETEEENEVNALSHSFNQMISRIDEAYRKQREFTGNASHELKTPITRITTQLENILQDKNLSPELRNSLQSVTDDAFQLSEIVMSLLLLSKIDHSKSVSLKKVRPDELIFNSVSKLKKSYPDLRFHFEIVNNSDREDDLEVEGDDTLLYIAFTNLIKNAYLYSKDHSISCELKQDSNTLTIFITNLGESPKPEEIKSLFTAFSRASNSAQVPGSGLGLLIVKRIIDYHGATVKFDIPAPGQNCISIIFKRA